MKFDVSGKVSGGGWSMTLEADSAHAALAKAMESESHPNGLAYEITVREHSPFQSQHTGMLMRLPPPLLTVTR